MKTFSYIFYLACFLIIQIDGFAQSSETSDGVEEDNAHSSHVSGPKIDSVKSPASVIPNDSNGRAIWLADYANALLKKENIEGITIYFKDFDGNDLTSYGEFMSMKRIIAHIISFIKDGVAEAEKPVSFFIRPADGDIVGIADANVQMIQENPLEVGLSVGWVSASPDYFASGVMEGIREFFQERSAAAQAEEPQESQ